MKKHWIYYLIFVLSTLSTQAQVKPIFDTEPLLIAEGDSSILYPDFKGFSGAENINTYLQKYINQTFHLDINHLDLEAAAHKGLDSLMYNVFETDSTISVRIKLLCHKGKLTSRWNDFFTFSKETGKALLLYDVFSEEGNASISNIIIRQQRDHIAMLRNKFIEAYNQGAITKKIYDALWYITLNYTLSASNTDNFLLTEECVIVHNGIILPYELSGYLPEFFRVYPWVD